MHAKLNIETFFILKKSKCSLFTDTHKLISQNNNFDKVHFSQVKYNQHFMACLGVGKPALLNECYENKNKY